MLLLCDFTSNCVEFTWSDPFLHQRELINEVPDQAREATIITKVTVCCDFVIIRCAQNTAWHRAGPQLLLLAASDLGIVRVRELGLSLGLCCGTLREDFGESLFG